MNYVLLITGNLLHLTAARKRDRTTLSCESLNIFFVLINLFDINVYLYPFFVKFSVLIIHAMQKYTRV